MEKALYTGIFVDHGTLLDMLYDNNPTVVNLGRLEKTVPDNYISVAFRSDAEGLEKFYGKKVTLKIVGYGRDDNNEGLKAEIYPTDDEDLNLILRGVADPVIPLSTSSKGLIKNTKTLRFWSLFNPFFIDGVFAGVDSKGHIVAPSKAGGK